MKHQGKHGGEVQVTVLANDNACQEHNAIQKGNFHDCWTASATDQKVELKLKLKDGLFRIHFVFNGFLRDFRDYDARYWVRLNHTEFVLSIRDGVIWNCRLKWQPTKFIKEQVTGGSKIGPFRQMSSTGQIEIFVMRFSRSHSVENSWAMLGQTTRQRPFFKYHPSLRKRYGIHITRASSTRTCTLTQFQLID